MDLQRHSKCMNYIIKPVNAVMQVRALGLFLIGCRFYQNS